MNPFRRIGRAIRASLVRRALRKAWRDGADPVDIIDLELQLQHLTTRKP